MNLLFVGRLPPQQGGSPVLALELLDALAARGHRVVALGPVTPETRPGRRAIAARHAGLVLRDYPVPYYSGSNGPAIVDERYRTAEGEALRRRLPRLIARERPDVIVVGQESSAWHVPRLARDHGRPTVVWVQGGSTFMGLSARYPATPTPPALLEEFRAATRLVTVGEHLAADLRMLGLVRIRTIPNAVDLVRFAPRPPCEPLRRALGLDAGDVVVLHLSNLKPTKRIGDLVAAMARAMRVDPRLRCLVVGDGPTRANAQRECAARGLASRFRFPGWVPRTAVPDYLSLADVVVSTSVHEGQSLVCLEGQASARLVVGTDIPGNRELIADGETGVLVPLGDAAALAGAILRAAADPAWRREVGHRARRARQAYPHAAMMDAHEEVLREVAAEAAAG